MNKSLLAAPVRGGGISVYDLDVIVEYSALELSDDERITFWIWVFEDPQQTTAMAVQIILKHSLSSLTIKLKDNVTETRISNLPEDLITLAQLNTDDTKGFIALWPLARPYTSRTIGAYDCSITSNTGYEPNYNADVLNTFILVCLPTEMFADENLESVIFTLREIP